MIIRIFLFGLLALLACNSPESISHSDNRVTQQLDSLLAQHEYFRFRVVLYRDRSSLSIQDRLIYGAFAANAFHDESKSNAMIREVLSNAAFRLSDSLKANLLFIHRDNFIKLYDYKNVSQTGDTLLARYANQMDAARVHHVRNLNTLYHGIADVPPQSVHIITDQRISYTKDQVGLVNIPVRTGNTVYDFVFDTRASISTITNTHSKKLKLRMIDTPYEESSGTTGKTFKTYPAVADSLWVGELLIRNVIFQVVPDSVLAFPSLNYQIKGIIGFPVITQWKEVRVHDNGTITIPSAPVRRGLNNLAFDESTTVINLKTDLDTLAFHFDSGATSSMLYYNYFKRYEVDVKSRGYKKPLQVGGAGGSKIQENYVYPTFSIHVGGREVKLKDIQVLMAAIYPGQKYYGNIGQDFLSNFQETILNFEEMYLDLR
jgi:hypothetical protein